MISQIIQVQKYQVLHSDVLLSLFLKVQILLIRHVFRSKKGHFFPQVGSKIKKKKNYSGAK
jgi:hypothetical protein